jgi:hypothetical protein
MPRIKAEIEPVVNTMVRMPETLYEVCKRYATKERRSVSAQFIVSVERWVSQEQGKAFLGTPCPKERVTDATVDHAASVTVAGASS